MARHDHGAHVASRHGHARSPHWHQVASAHLAMFPRCVCCAPGQAEGEPVQVHHIIPFHYCITLGRPDLELDQRNLVTLCESSKGHHAPNHHLLVGHADDFESSNLNLVRDTMAFFHGLSEQQIRQSPQFQVMVANRVKPLHHFTQQDAAYMRQLMDTQIPRQF